MGHDGARRDCPHTLAGTSRLVPASPPTTRRRRRRRRRRHPFHVEGKLQAASCKLQAASCQPLSRSSCLLRSDDGSILVNGAQPLPTSATRYVVARSTCHRYHRVARWTGREVGGKRWDTQRRALICWSMILRECRIRSPTNMSNKKSANYLPSSTSSSSSSTPTN